jgi:hypothetical protein
MCLSVIIGGQGLRLRSTQGHADITSQEEAHDFVAKCGPHAIKVVIAGLDPAIHPLRKNFFGKKKDARVKPGHDAAEFVR